MVRRVNIALPDTLIARIDSLSAIDGGGIERSRSATMRRLLVRGLEVETKRRESR